MDEAFALSGRKYRFTGLNPSPYSKNMEKSNEYAKLVDITEFKQTVKVLREVSDALSMLHEKINTSAVLEDLKNIESFEEKNAYVNRLYKGQEHRNRVRESYMANYNVDPKHFHWNASFLDGRQYHNQVDLFVGGSPCQSFSLVGKQRGLEDTRGTLFYEFARLVKEIQPKVFIYENVKAVLSNDDGNTWRTMKDVFDELNYDWHDAILNAKDYGVPQNRERLFVIGFRKDLNVKEFKFPEPIKLDKTMQDYLIDNVSGKYFLPQKGVNFVTDKKNLDKRYTQIDGDIQLCQKKNQQFNWHGDFVFAVIEMGMNHLLEIDFLTKMVKPDIAIITNIGNAHLATMRSLENIIQAKLEIVIGLQKNGVLIINGDDDLLIKQAKKLSCQQLTFGERKTNHLYLTSIDQDENTLRFTVSNNETVYEMPLIGKHQAVNSLAVIQAARLVELSDQDIQSGLRHVQLSAQRNEVQVFGSVTIINDTYKSNPESVEAAIQTLISLPDRKRKIFIMGDMVDMGDQAISLHRRMGEFIAESTIDLVLGSGELTQHTIASITKRKTSCQAYFFQTEADLIEAIIDCVAEPCIILFKASRSIQFDKVVAVIEERLSK